MNLVSHIEKSHLLVPGMDSICSMSLVFLIVEVMGLKLAWESKILV